MSQILFICTGNYYRSRFAEAFFNHLAEQRGCAWRAYSRGLATHVIVSGDISDHTVAALEERGIPVSRRLPMQVTGECLEGATRVIALKEAEHRPLFDHIFPDWSDKVEYWHVDDIDYVDPSEALPQIEQKVTELIDYLLAQEMAGGTRKIKAPAPATSAGQP